MERLHQGTEALAGKPDHEAFPWQRCSAKFSGAQAEAESRICPALARAPDHIPVRKDVGLQERYLWWPQEKGGWSCSPGWPPEGWWCKRCWPWGRWHWQSSVSPALWCSGFLRGCRAPAPGGQSSQRPPQVLSRWAGDHPSQPRTLRAGPAQAPPLHKDRESGCYSACRLVLMSGYLMNFTSNQGTEMPPLPISALSAASDSIKSLWRCGKTEQWEKDCNN